MAGEANKILNFDQGRSDQPSLDKPAVSMGGVKIAVLVKVGGGGELLVAYAGGPGPLAARTLLPLGQEDCGREVLLAFEDGDGRRPVVVGCLQPGPRVEQERKTLALERGDVDHLVVDGQTVNIRAHKEIVLQCGQASITLNRNGKVVIRGSKIITHASGVNKIKGAAVSIN